MTPEVAKHRLFVWIKTETGVIIDHKLYVFVRDDDYFFGVLHSRAHEVWSLHKAGRHGVGNDPAYNSRRCFGTFPMPWSPRSEPQSDPLYMAIASSARELESLRSSWLTANEQRTLTNLYNQRPTWLELAHKKLDQAVFAAYGWQYDLSDDDILSRLLDLNLERAAKQVR